MENTIFDNIIKYFDHLHDQTEMKLSPSTLKTFFSVFSQYFLHNNIGDLRKLCPIIYSNIKKWSKTHTTKQAATFTEEELELFYLMPNTPFVLQWKIWYVCMMAGANRGAELYYLKFKNLKD